MFLSSLMKWWGRFSLSLRPCIQTSPPQELRLKGWKRSHQGASVRTSHKIGENQHKKQHGDLVTDSLELLNRLQFQQMAMPCSGQWTNSELTSQSLFLVKIACYCLFKPHPKLWSEKPSSQIVSRIYPFIQVNLQRLNYYSMHFNNHSA